MRPGTPAGVCDCGEPTEYVERAPGYVAAEHVARGGRERHAEWVEEIERRSLGRVLCAALILAAVAVVMVAALAGCVSTAHRMGAATAEGGVAYLSSPPGEARVRAVGAQIGEAAGQAAARAARTEAASGIPLWALVTGLVLLATVPLAGIAWAVKSLMRFATREMNARGFHAREKTS